jgi:hypothetical protein
LGKGTHSLSTFITRISSMTFGSTTSISSEKDCNSRARGKFICSLVSLDSSTLQETRLAMGLWDFLLGFEHQRNF